VEPAEESKNSAFTIIPKSAKVDAQGLTAFEIEFDPSQQFGQYVSIIQSHPYIEEEKAINLGVVCAIAEAETVQPFMTPEKKERQEKEFHLKFEALAGIKSENEIKALTLTNYTAAILSYSVVTEGNYAITSSKTLTPHPLASKENPTMFITHPRNNVEFTLKFNKPNSDDLNTWPMVKEVLCPGKLLLNYSNGCTQAVLIDGYLYRPVIEMLTEDYKQISYPEREIDVGTVNIDGDKTRTVKIYLVNRSKVPAKWSINYIKHNTKALATLHTLTKVEKEYLSCIDDSTVFALNMSGVSI
jgi:hypothetical protein